MNENSIAISAPTTPENNANSSMHKAKTRVSNMIFSLSKWFSPSDQNGNLRRKRESESDTESNIMTPGTTVASTSAPSAKRFRSEHDEQEQYPTTSTNPYSTRKFSSSTPTITTPNRRRMLGRLANSSPYTFSDSTIINTRLRNQTTTTTTTATAVEDNGENSSDDETNANDDIILTDSYSSELSNRKRLNIPPTTRPISRILNSSLMSPNRFSTTNTIAHDVTKDDDVEQEALFNGTLNESASESEDSSSRITFTQPNKYSTKRPQSSAGRINTSLVRDDESDLHRRPSGLFGTGSKRSRPNNNGLLNFSAHLQTNKSLFSDKNMPNSLHNSTTSLNSLNRRQSLNTSLYGSSTALSDSQTTNTNSPFYNGRTMYGGASGYPRRAISVQRPLRVPTQIRPSSIQPTMYSSINSLANIEPDMSALSSTAKRYLDLINQCTTPLADVKKMASNANNYPALVNHRKRFDDNDLMLSRSMRLSTPKTGVNNIRKSPPTNELQVPSMSQLWQMKKILRNNTEKVREVATTSNSILNQTGEYKLPDNSNSESSQSKRQNKIRNKISTTRVSTKNVLDENVQEVNLPNISLPVLKDIPDIDLPLARPKTAIFDVIQPISTQPASSSMLAVNKIAQNKYPKDDNTVPMVKSQFSFSSPTEVKMPSFVKNVEPVNNFKFSEPINVEKSKNSSNTLAFSSIQSNAKQQIKEDAGKELPQLKNASVLEALNIPKTSISSLPVSTSIPAQPSLSHLFKSSSKQWECSCCMIKNDDTKDKCVACETPRSKPPPTLQQTTSVPLINSFGSQFKANTNTWECSSCMIRNKLDALKCIACETAKTPVIGKSQSDMPKITVPSSDQGFKSLVAQQNTRWECTACLTRNDANRKKCECCEQAKPGSSSDKTPSFSFGSGSAAAPKFNFGVPFNEKVASTVVPVGESKSTIGETKSTFSFGVQPSTYETDGPAKTFSFGDQTKAKSQESKNDAPVPTFSVGAKPSITSNENESTASDKIVSTPALSGFKFGASTSISQAKPVTTTNVTFGSSNKPTADDKVKETKSNELVFGSKNENIFISPTSTTSSVTPLVSSNLASTTNSAISFGSLKNDQKSTVFGTPTSKSDSIVNLPQTKTPFTLPTTTIAQITATQSAQSTSTATLPSTTTPVFAFGQTQNAVKGGFSFTPTPVVKDKQTFPMPDFAQSQTKSVTPTLSFGSSNVTVTSAAAITNSSSFFFGQPSATTIQQLASDGSATSTFGATPNAPASGFNFGSTSTSSQPLTNAFGTQQQATSVFAPAATAITSSLPTEPATSPFMFRSTTTIDATPAFGQSAASSFGQPSVTSVQPFGGFGTQTPTPSPSFSATPSAFGSTLANNPAPSAFGTASPFGSTGNPNTTPTFGSTGNNGLSTFSVSNNFGSPSAGFGSMIHSAPASSDEPSAKKHTSGFGSLSNTNVQKPPAFSFGDSSNNNNAKASFAFSATASPSFNFSGSQQTNSSPYTFGSSTATPTAGVFNFGSGSTEAKSPNAPFQFAGSSDVTNNLFAPQPSSTNSANRKKIRAVRRNPR